MSLLTYPRRRVGVPLVTFVGDRTRYGIEPVPAHLPSDRALDCIADEPASPARPGQLVDLRYQIVVQLNVHSHV